MMRRGIIRFRLVALCADRVTLGNQCIAVRVVTVAAHDPGLGHFALHERPINVDFVANLPVVPVKGRLDNRQAVGIE